MTTLYQLELDQTEVDCGMSYVFQLSNGHFFLIDGGYFSQGEADRLLAFLCAHCDGKPVVDGWFFSHAHQDHIGVFIDMMLLHRNELQINGLYFNFQPLDLPATGEGWRIKSNDLATVRFFYEVLETCCPDIPVHTLHTGDQLRFEELTLEVLYTHEELNTQSSFNDHSTVLLATVNGQKMLFLGDVYSEGSRFMLENCPEKLRCDIVQVSHHGYAGALKALYQATGATVALWPAPLYSMESNAEREANRYLLQESDIREHLISGKGTVGLALPYVPA